MVYAELPLFLCCMCFLRHLPGSLPAPHSFCSQSPRRCQEADGRQSCLQPAAAATATAPIVATTLLHPASVSDVETSRTLRVSGFGTPMLRSLEVLDPSPHMLSSMLGVLCLLHRKPSWVTVYVRENSVFRGSENFLLSL